LSENHDGCARYGNTDECKQRHSSGQSESLAKHLRALALRVSSEIGDVERKSCPVSDICSQCSREQRPERSRALLKLHRVAKNATQAPAISNCPDEKSNPAKQKKWCRPALENLDAFRTLENDPHLDEPENRERNGHRHTNVCPSRPQCLDQRVEREPADPRLNSKPSARHDCAQHRRDICASYAKTRAAQNGKGNSVFSSRMRV